MSENEENEENGLLHGLKVALTTKLNIQFWHLFIAVGIGVIVGVLIK